ncbi:MAG: hypothetical protein BGO09_15265 [Bacteroidetes bacterium 47-18]|nr:MAG: hypothetical protein BGO09_15265 [Bacteroidetes bacterium 47-18]
MHQINNQQKFTLGVLILAGILCRTLNFEIGDFHIVPIGALALFGGYALRNRYPSILVPVLTMFISDLYLEVTQPGFGFYDISQVFVYLGMASFAVLGCGMKSGRPLSVLGYTLTGSLVFWIVSNLGVYLAGYYGYSFSGLVTTYVMALPFRQNDAYSNLLFFNIILVNVAVAQVIFAAYHYALSRNSRAVKAA